MNPLVSVAVSHSLAVAAGARVSRRFLEFFAVCKAASVTRTIEHRGDADGEGVFASSGRRLLPLLDATDRLPDLLVGHHIEKSKAEDLLRMSVEQLAPILLKAFIPRTPLRRRRYIAP